MSEINIFFASSRESINPNLCCAKFVYFDRKANGLSDHNQLILWSVIIVLKNIVKQQRPIFSSTHNILKVKSIKKCVCINFLWVNISVHFSDIAMSREYIVNTVSIVVMGRGRYYIPHAFLNLFTCFNEKMCVYILLHLSRGSHKMIIPSIHLNIIVFQRIKHLPFIICSFLFGAVLSQKKILQLKMIWS